MHTPGCGGQRWEGRTTKIVTLLNYNVHHRIAIIRGERQLQQEHVRVIEWYNRGTEKGGEE